MRIFGLGASIGIAVALAAGCGGAKTQGPQGAEWAPCGGDPTDRGPSDVNEPEQLTIASDEFWTHMLKRDPTMATRLGISGYDDLLPDASPEGINERLAEATRLYFLAQTIDPTFLSARERITLAILLHELRSEYATRICEAELWEVDHLWGPQIWLLSLGTQTPVKTPEDERNYLARLSKFGTYIDQRIGALKVGLARGLTPPRLNVERTLQQLKELSEVPDAEYALLAADGQLPEEQRAAFRKRIRAVVSETVRPAFARYRAFLADGMLPKARNKVGINALPKGTECYRALIRQHTSRDDTPQQIHDLGLAEMKRIRAEMTAVATKLFPGKSLPDVLTMLRDDPQYGFSNRDEVHNTAMAVVKRAEARLPEVFAVLPKAPVEVKRMEPHAEKDSPMAYYFNPSADGKRAGTYYVNTYEPRSRPRYTSEVLAFHEAVPGHHLQIAVAMELDGIPDFQKHAGTTAFVEGWGLYAERLSDEMGLYTGELDRLGMLSFEAWRAARLVVDTGLHAFGWTRQQAIDYMLANTASALPDIENEVDRYITWPGQALAYKLGQIEILRLRERAKQQLGERFDLREFHRIVLRNGAVPLNVLEREVQRWINETNCPPPGPIKRRRGAQRSAQPLDPTTCRRSPAR